jgi:hypothetical protein
MKLTYALIFAEPNEPEADGKHSGMNSKRDSFRGIF